ncbi:MAG: class I SAM-dependent methyltransferase [Fervidobacterium sp.]
MFKFYNKSHEYYDKIAKVYDEMYKDCYWLVARAHIEEFIKKYVGTIEGKLILDVGSGTGEWSLWAAKQRAIVHLLEPSKEMLEISKNKLSAHFNLNILNSFKFYNMTIEEFQPNDLEPGKEVRYDIIFLLGDVLSYVEKLDKALITIKSVSKPGTILLGTVDNYYSYVRDIIIHGEWSDYAELEKKSRE